jgi:beta-glucosidase
MFYLFLLAFQTTLVSAAPSRSSVVHKGTKFPYQQPSLPISQRVDDLISRMSIDELIGQTWHPLSQTTAKIIEWCAKGVGATIVPDGATPLLRLQNRNKLQADCMNANPLGIPLSFHEEGLHAGALGGTNFPEPLLTACTWNESLASQIGAAIAFEARGAGVDNVWSPVVNMWVE